MVDVNDLSFYWTFLTFFSPFSLWFLPLDHQLWKSLKFFFNFACSLIYSLLILSFSNSSTHFFLLDFDYGELIVMAWKNFIDFICMVYISKSIVFQILVLNYFFYRLRIHLLLSITGCPVKRLFWDAVTVKILTMWYKNDTWLYIYVVQRH